MRKAFLMLPLFLTLLTSGCTVPGGFCIPGLTCGATVEETHDVIVIESLQVLPSNVPPGGTINLVAIVSNVADINAEISDAIPVVVELYDYCEGMFTATPSFENPITLLRGEKKQVEWVLKAKPKDQVPVRTECNVKVLARYEYSTKSLTTLHLIDYTEMQRRINEGTYSEVGSYISVGYGPIKPYIRVEGSQPIPVADNKVNTVVSLQVINKGQGFLSAEDGNIPVTGPLITESMIEITGLDGFAEGIKTQLDACNKNNIGDGLKLIKGESTKIPCEIKDADANNVPVESTKSLTAEVKDYYYEFRKEIKVTVVPTF